jgi:hypothetical protein
LIKIKKVKYLADIPEYQGPRNNIILQLRLPFQKAIGNENKIMAFSKQHCMTNLDGLLK